MLLDFKTYKATVIKTVQFGHKDEPVDQWNRSGSPKINSCIYGQLIFDIEAKTIPKRKEFFQQKRPGQLDIHLPEK